MLLIRRLAAALCLAAALVLPAAAQTQTTKVTFILVNDIYQMNETAMPDGKSRGGFARLAAAVKAERAKAAALGGHAIFAHAGDTLSPSLLSGIDRGAHIIALTNMLAPDIFVPGNHEFDFGRDIFLQRMAEAKFPLYAANLRAAGGARLAGFRDRAMLEFGGVRIGLTGAAADDSPAKSNPGDLQFAPAVDSIRAQAAALRSEGADFVVAVIHADRSKDYALFHSRAADLILSGDDHDLFVNYDGRTAMIESRYDAHYVAAIDVTVSSTLREGRREVTWQPQFRVIDTAELQPDEIVAAAIRQFEQQLSKEMDVAIATSAIELDSRLEIVRTREAAIGNLFADALRARTGADVALTNGGGMRGEKIYRAGSMITRRDMASEMIFGNQVALIAVSGHILKLALENGLSILPHPDGRFPHISGMTIEADPSRPPGQRIVSLRIGGAPVDEQKIYKLATNDYLARGGDGYGMLRDAPRLMRDYDGPLMASEVMLYLGQIGTLRTGIEGRIVFK
jgi:2',3'-cyclic-nucleotide 2'-phosphodiesterase (5'-nucleotidase family)